MSNNIELADEAKKLEIERTISLVGNVEGSVEFDGSKNVEIQTSIKGGDIKDTVISFTECQTKEEINSGEQTSTIFGKIKKWFSELSLHMENKNNPHQVTKEQLDLGNLDNTRDLDKPISVSMKNALDKKLDKTESIINALHSQNAINANMLDGKYGNYYAPIESPNFTGEVNIDGILKTKGIFIENKTKSFSKLTKLVSVTMGKWYTFAKVNQNNNKANAQFMITIEDSLQHQTIHFVATHMFAKGNSIMIQSNEISSDVQIIKKLRILYNENYDGALLQVFVGEENPVGDEMYLIQACMINNASAIDWELCDFLENPPIQGLIKSHTIEEIKCENGMNLSTDVLIDPQSILNDVKINGLPIILSGTKKELEKTGTSTYKRFFDGTQICYGNYPPDSYRIHGEEIIFPISFKEGTIPCVQITCWFITKGKFARTASVVFNDITNTKCRIATHGENTLSEHGIGFMYMAIGEWK